MHETSLVNSLLRQVDRVLVQNQAAVAKVIEIEMGPLCGAEPELIRSAFDRFAIDSRWSKTKLIIRQSHLVVECLQCQAASQLDKFVFRCKQCGSGNVKVIAGDQLRLLFVTIAEPEMQSTSLSSNQESANVKHEDRC